MRFKDRQTTSLIRTTLPLTLLVMASAAEAARISIAQTPLFVSGSADPNIMLTVDNSGSMSNVVPEQPYSDSTACPAANIVPTNQAIDLNIRVSDGAPMIFYVGSSNRYLWGTGSGQRCFDRSQSYGVNPAYAVRLNADLNVNNSTGAISGSCGTTCTVASGYLGTGYSGDYLNWYFNPASVAGVTWGGRSDQRVKPLSASASCPGQATPTGNCVKTRIQIARTAGVNLVNSLDNRLRVGFSTYYTGGTDTPFGGQILEGVGPVGAAGSAKRSSLINRINSIVASGSTPLAETLSDIGRYFSTGYAGNLALHPDLPSRRVTNRTVAQVFNNHRFNDPNNVVPSDSCSATSPSSCPVTLSCQRNFAVMLTDGRPNQDRVVSSDFQDYDGDCIGANPACGSYDQKAASILPARTYEASGSDYLDDVAQALYEMDLRPDFPSEISSASQFRNNVQTYFIGFADPAVQNDELLKSAARQGGTQTVQVANNSSALASVFSSIISNILATTGSFSSVASNSTRLNTGTRVLQASFNSGPWTGDLRSFPVSDGVTPCLAGGVIQIGELCGSEWSAAANLVSATGRRILTYNPSTRTGIPFQWANLTAAQQGQLAAPAEAGTTLTTNGTARLNFLRGDRSTESQLVTPRSRRGTVLGDIVDSSPFYSGPPSFNYADGDYAQFRRNYASRDAMVYVGSNDGMLHGFKASDGIERIAYVPSPMFGSGTRKPLFNLTQTPFVHAPLVNGSPTVGDAYVGAPGSGGWRTVLVGGLNGGGRGIYALDVTDPSRFAETGSGASSTVMWEFTSADDLDLGYTYSQPSIVKMSNGKWAAVIGNGYTSNDATETNGSGRASLFILFVDGPDRSTGWGSGAASATARYIKLTTTAGSAANPNGLATPAAVDIDGDDTIDYLYAGDEQGNLWRFDVRSTDPGSWGVGNGGQPLFTATDGSTPQPITERPEVGYNLLATNPTSPTNPNLAVYFGTGRYIDSGDPATSGVQTFYGIFDKFPTTARTISRASDLVQQKITQEVGRATDGGATTCTGSAIAAAGSCYRITTNNAVPAARYGWYIDLYNTSSGNTATLGERQISSPILRGGRIIFTTLIPSTDSCSPGGGGWLMELSARDGKMFPTPVFDTNADRQVTSADSLTVTLADGSKVQVAASGVRSNVGIPTTPDILTISGNREVKYRAGSGAQDATGAVRTLETLVESAAGRVGRITWREINP